MKSNPAKRREWLLPFLQKLLSRKSKKEAVSYALQEAINACTTEQQLTDLLFSLPMKTEAELKAFDRRFLELEQSA